MKRIPLDTKYDYFCSEDGKIFRGDKELKGYEHEGFIPGKGKFGGRYRRFSLMMKSGQQKKFYAQRLVAMTYLNLLAQPEKIVRHLTNDSFNNHKDCLLVGSHYENQTIDRIEQGTYMNRGGGEMTVCHPLIMIYHFNI